MQTSERDAHARRIGPAIDRPAPNARVVRPARPNLPRWVEAILRVPLAGKLAGANAIIVLAATGAALAVHGGVPADARVLMVTMHSGALMALKALEAGAWGYVSKSSGPKELVRAVAAVAQGQQALCDDTQQAIATQRLADPMAVLDEPRDVPLGGVVGHAGHWHPLAPPDVAARQDDVEGPGDDPGVLVKRLVEVAQAEEQDRVGVARLQFEVLATHRRRRQVLGAEKSELIERMSLEDGALPVPVPENSAPPAP